MKGKQIDVLIIISIIYNYRMNSHSKNSKMDFIERITLSPFEKYVRFGLFPWKFVFHLLLVVFCTFQALKIVSIQDKHTRIQEQVFSTIYLQNQQGTTDFPYYSLSDFTDTFFGIFDQTDILNETLLQYSNIEDVEYKLDVYYSQMNPKDKPVLVFQGNQTQFIDSLGTIPIHQNQYAQMKKFIQEVESMHLQIRNIITYISTNQQGQMQSCLNWTVHIAYNFESFANVQSELEGQSFTCYINGIASEDQSMLGIHFLVMVFSMMSLLFSWRQIYHISKEYMIYKSSISNNEVEIRKSKLNTTVDFRKNWQQLGFFDKMKFFDFWFIVTVTGNFFQMFGALVAILDQFITLNFKIFQHKELLIGFGVMLAWITILKYLQYTQNLNLMTATLSKSWGNLFMFLLGVMPFFLGFVFLGQTIFWKYNKFQDTSSSVITLFSLLNGDIVNDTFLQTWAQGLVGQIYLIIFMILFYTAVQNVFVTIIMEGYQESIKEKEYKKLLDEKDEKQKQNMEQNLINLTIANEQFSDNQLSPQQQSGLNKIKLNGNKIDKILEQMCKLSQQISSSNLKLNEKQYLNGLVKDYMETAYHSINMHLKKIEA